MTTSFSSYPFEQALQEHRHFLLQQGQKDKLRDKAWEKYLQRPLSAQAERYRPLPLRKLQQGAFPLNSNSLLQQEYVASHLLPECQNSCLVFVNGTFSPHLSRCAALPESLLVLTLSVAQKKFASFLQGRLGQSIKEEEDPLLLLNMALYQEGAFLYLPPKLQVEAPVQLLHLYDSPEPQLLFPRLHLFAGKGSHLQLIQTEQVLTKAPIVVISCSDIVVEEHAFVRHTALRLVPENLWHFSFLRSHLKQQSCLHHHSCSSGSIGMRDDLALILAGERAEARLHGATFLQGQRHGHTSVSIEHKSPSCHSHQHFKNVLKDYSRASFEGKIYVHSEAQKTDAFQLNNNLLLGSHCIAYAKPNLEIFADDVKASHGATTGPLDAEALFYLQTRGMDAKEATSFLVQAFCRQFVDQLPLPSLRMQTQLWLERYLQREEGHEPL